MLCYLVQVVSPFITSFRYLFAFLPLPFRLLLYVLLRKKERIPCSIHPACLSFTTSSILPLSIHTRRCISRPVKKSLALLSKKIFVHSGVFERKKFRERHRCTKRHLEASKVDTKKTVRGKKCDNLPLPFLFQWDYLWLDDSPTRPSYLAKFQAGTNPHIHMM